MNAVSKSDSNSNPEDIILDLNDLSHVHSPNDSLQHQTNSPDLNKPNILQNSVLTLSQLKAQPEEDQKSPNNNSVNERRAKLEQLRKKRERKPPVTDLIEEQPPITLQKPTDENKDSLPEYSQPKSESPDPKYQILKDKSSSNPDANLPNASFIEYDLQNTINQAEEFSTIYLPEKVIKVHELIITKPIVIIGSTGSIIEVTHSIHVSLVKYPEPDQRVIFLECTFDFDYSGQKYPVNQSLSTKRGSKESGDIRVSDKKSYSDTINNNLTKYMNGQGGTTEIHRTLENPSSSENRIHLFAIYPNTVLDLKDCRITSRNNDTGNTSQDICFYLKSPQTSVLQELINHPNLIVQSTFISNFYTAVQNYMVGRVYLEKIFISNSKDHAINISNPYILEMKECIIENSFKSCVNIRFSKDIESDVERRVLIKNNEFSKGQSYGVSIFGENMVPQACIIVLEENKMAWFQKDAVGIKNLNINGIWLQANDMANNNGNGICAHNVIDTKTFSQIRLGKNKIHNNHLYGITLIDASFYSEHDEITLNAKGGVIISAAEKIKNKKEYTFYKNCPLRTIFNSTKIMNNNDSGVVIVGSLKGPIIFNTCQLSENTNGMYIKQIQIEEFKKADANNANNTALEELGSIVLERCSVLHNTSSGIYLRNMTNKMYIKATAIYGNKNYAIYIQNQEEADHLVLTQEGKEKVRDYISGFIGGSWGLLHGQNSTNACHNTNCSIF